MNKVKERSRNIFILFRIQPTLHLLLNSSPFKNGLCSYRVGVYKTNDINHLSLLWISRTDLSPSLQAYLLFLLVILLVCLEAQIRMVPAEDTLMLKSAKRFDTWLSEYCK